MLLFIEKIHPTDAALVRQTKVIVGLIQFSVATNFTLTQHFLEK